MTVDVGKAYFEYSLLFYPFIKKPLCIGESWMAFFRVCSIIIKKRNNKSSRTKSHPIMQKDLCVSVRKKIFLSKVKVNLF